MVKINDPIEQQLKKAIQPQDGIIATNFNSKISIYLVRLLSKSKVTPNQVSIFSFITALGAAYFFSVGSYVYLLMGAFLLQISFVLDCADGELARFKNMASPFGAWLDRLFDRLTEFAVVFGITYGQWQHSKDWRIWILGFLLISTLLIGNYAADSLGKLPKNGDTLRKKIATKLNRSLGLKDFIKPGYLSFGRDLQIFFLTLGCIINRVKSIFLLMIILGSIWWILRAILVWRTRESLI